MAPAQDTPKTFTQQRRKQSPSTRISVQEVTLNPTCVLLFCIGSVSTNFRHKVKGSPLSQPVTSSLIGHLVNDIEWPIARISFLSVAIFLRLRAFVCSPATCPSAPFRDKTTAAQAKVRAISEIVEQLVAGVKESREVNLPLIRRDACAKYSLARAPKLVEIISAVPDDYRDTLLPRCSILFQICRLLCARPMHCQACGFVSLTRDSVCCRCLPTCQQSQVPQRRLRFNSGGGRSITAGIGFTPDSSGL